eukprot:UN01116
MVGILIVIFVHRRHWKNISHVSKSHVKTGLRGHAGNKGGAAIRLRIYDSTLCFVCSHLAAHKKNVEGRNADFHNIKHGMRFNVDGKTHQFTRISDHDFVFWMGDLNYRLNLDDLDLVYKKIEHKDYNYYR